MRQLVVISLAFFAYMATRKLALVDIHAASLHAQQIIGLEKTVGFFWEPAWQTWAVGHLKVAVIFLNWAYILSYAPVILVTGLALFAWDRPRYHFYRNVIFVSLAMALAVFILYPMAPPKFFSNTFSDTIQTFGPSIYGGGEMNKYVNIYAAMPSMHFSWGLIFGIICLRSGSKWLKVPGVVYPLLVFVAITITGNHYIADAIGGTVITGAAFGIVLFFQRRGPPALERFRLGRNGP